MTAHLRPHASDCRCGACIARENVPSPTATSPHPLSTTCTGVGGIEPTDKEVMNLIENKVGYLGLDTSNPMDARDAMHAVQLERIGLFIGFGRAQQLLGKMWEHHFNVAPRGRMGVTATDAPALTKNSEATP